MNPDHGPSTSGVMLRSCVFSMSKSAIVTGITGQDGSCLAELPRSKGCELRRHPRLRYHFNMIGHRWQLQREQPWGHTAPETQLTLVGM